MLTTSWALFFVYIYLLKTKEQRGTAMEKISKLKGPRGNEMMKPVLQQNNRKRGSDGRGAGSDSKRQRKVIETLSDVLFSGDILLEGRAFVESFDRVANASFCMENPRPLNAMVNRISSSFEEKPTDPRMTVRRSPVF